MKVWGLSSLLKELHGNRGVNRMAEYKVELIMSEEYTINAGSEEEAEQKAREKFGCDYYIDSVKVTEIKK